MKDVSLKGSLNLGEVRGSHGAEITLEKIPRSKQSQKAIGWGNKHLSMNWKKNFLFDLYQHLINLFL